MPVLSRHSQDEPNWLEKVTAPSEAETRKKILAWILVFASYFLTAQIGIYLYKNIGTSPAVIWPPVGIALAAVLLEGYWIGSAIAMGALLSSYVAGTPAFLIFGLVIASTVQPLVGGYLLRKLRFNSLLNTLRDVFLLIGVSVCATIILPLTNYGFVYLYSRFTGATQTLPPWTALWVGGALSALVLVPFLSRWIGHDLAYRTRLQQLELMFSVLLIAVLSYVIFATSVPPFLSTLLLLCLLAAFLWIAFRIGPRAMSLALLVMTSISLAGVIYGIHFPSEQTLSDRLLTTEIFDLIMAAFFFILVSVEEQRKNALKNLSLDAERLETALETIRAEDRAKNEFIATLAHELRNPLAPIMSGLELLKLDETKPEKLEILESAQRQSFMMRRLLDELLDVARITRKSFVLKKENVSLQKVLNESVDSVLYMYKDKGQIFSSEIPKEEIWVHGDPVRLTQIFTNILYNAGKYTAINGKIALTLEKKGTDAVVAVKDTGIGIAKDMLTRIFDPFVQDLSRDTVGAGLGIGLSIAKHLVEMHEGTVVAESGGKDRGSSFIITLPIRTMHETSKSQAAAASGGAQSSVLVVDDNQDAAKSIAKLLRARGNTVDMAFNGKEALAALSKKPSYILLDIGLPDIEGHVVAKEIHERLPEATVIALSGYGSREDKLKAQEAGIAVHLTKPASLRDIEAAMAAGKNA